MGEGNGPMSKVKSQYKKLEPNQAISKLYTRRSLQDLALFYLVIDSNFSISLGKELSIQ